MRLGAKIFGALAGILILYLGIGFFLPGSWDAHIEATLDAPPETVFPFLSAPHRWVRWNAMPESGSTVVGPPEGIGAGLDWDDPRYGSGTFRITRSEPHRLVEYEVRIESGALRIQGAVTLEAEGRGCRMRWKESGDFGRNPLMGYAARGMGASQREAMRASLDSLRVLLEREPRTPTLP
jgi:uncharacterized protein YndB with AHSA1/START domain